jgi:hypothetical protein
VKAFIWKAMMTLILSFCVTSVSLAQVDKEGNDRRFYDDLLDNLVGDWEVSATVYGQKFTLEREAHWIMGHQYLRIYEKSREVIPWLKTRFERTILIGYNHSSKRYLVYELTVHGGDVPHEPEGFYYATRSGNELKMIVTKDSEVVGFQRFIWEPATSSWRFRGTRLIAGKEEPNVEQIAVSAKPTSTSP